jgi:hypothetical protein
VNANLDLVLRRLRSRPLDGGFRALWNLLRDGLLPQSSTGWDFKEKIEEG